MTALVFFLWLPVAVAVAVMLRITWNDRRYKATAHRDGYREGFFDATHGISHAYPPDDHRDDLATRRMPPSGRDPSR